MSLDDAIAQARACWPRLHVDEARFRDWLAERTAGTSLPSLHVGDLYLACACAPLTIGSRWPSSTNMS